MPPIGGHPQGSVRQVPWGRGMGTVGAHRRHPLGRHRDGRTSHSGRSAGRARAGPACRSGRLRRRLVHRRSTRRQSAPLGGHQRPACSRERGALHPALGQPKTADGEDRWTPLSISRMYRGLQGLHEAGGVWSREYLQDRWRSFTDARMAKSTDLESWARRPTRFTVFARPPRTRRQLVAEFKRLAGRTVPRSQLRSAKPASKWLVVAARAGWMCACLRLCGDSRCSCRHTT